LLAVLAATPSPPVYWAEPEEEPQQVFLEIGSAEYISVLESLNMNEINALSGGGMLSNNLTMVICCLKKI